MAQTAHFRVALHCMLHIAQADEHVTSIELAANVRTNPVVIRRTLAPLRDAGLVRTKGGRAGGWFLARPSSAITLADIYEALGEDVVASWLGPGSSEGCEVRAALIRGLASVRGEANTLIRQSLARQTLHDLGPPR